MFRKMEQGSDQSAALSVKTFGGLSFRHKGSPITIIWESQKARLLFCYLLITCDQWTHRDRLIELLWPEIPVSAGLNNFKTTMSRLRKSFMGPSTLNPVISQGDAVRLDTSLLAVDATQFRHHAATGIKLLVRGEAQAARQHLEVAQDLYTSHFLPEEPCNPFITSARSEFADLHHHALKSLEKIYLQEGNKDAIEVITLLQRSLLPVTS